MKSFIVSFISLVFVVCVSAEPLIEGRVQLDSGEPVANAQVRLYDLTDLEGGALARATTDATGSFALSLQAFSRGSALPQGFALGQNYPNPFNPSTIIPYQLPTATHVRLEVFNLLGQRLATLVDAERPAGFHTAQWDATDAAGQAVGAGVYLYRLIGDGVSASRRMVLIDGQAGIPAAGATGSPLPAAGATDGAYGLAVSGAGIAPTMVRDLRVAAGMAAVDVVVSAGSEWDALHDADEGPSPSGKALATLAAPAAPTNLRVEAVTDSSVRVLWDAVEGATDYDVNYKPAQGGRWTNEPHRGVGLSNTIDGLAPGTEYRWAVRAENSDGPSAWVFGPNFTTRSSAEDGLDAVSAAPTNLRFDAPTDSSCTVRWDAVEGATDYDVNYKPAVGGRWTNVPHRGVGLSNTIDGLAPGTEYRWAVRAENSDGPSAWVFGPNFTTLPEHQEEEEETPDEQEEETPEEKEEEEENLIVYASVSDNILTPGQAFILRARVQNQGTDAFQDLVLSYYRSLDAAISTQDMLLGTDEVGSLAASGTSGNESISLTASSTSGTYYYGACVASVRDEGDTLNYCSTGVRVVVADEEDQVSIPDANLRAAIASALGKAPGATITVAEMATLTRLDAPNSGIRDLTGLEFATSLTWLNLEDNAISDISPLSGLTNLTWLNLEDNAISDISPLSGLTNLEGLFLSGTTISDISALSGLTNLENLFLSGTTISDISALSGLTNLENLFLSGTTISDISALSGLTNLTWLYLLDNTISDISALSGLTNLTWLFLGGNAISDISALSGLTNLTRLYLLDTAISDISPLSGLTNLTWLALGYTAISDISALSGLTNLESLSLFATAISDISALSGLTNLTYLRSEGSAISDISALSGLTNLTGLNLAGNTISDISPLSGLTNLWGLNLGGNAISDISALSGLTNLTWLALDFNAISDISPLLSLTDLETLDIQFNPLNASSINDHIPALQARGVEVKFDSTPTPTTDEETPTTGDACAVGQELSPGQSCTVDIPNVNVGSNRFEVRSDGSGCYGNICAGTGVNLNGFQASKIAGTSRWRIDALPSAAGKARAKVSASGSTSDDRWRRRLAPQSEWPDGAGQ